MEKQKPNLNENHNSNVNDSKSFSSFLNGNLSSNLINPNSKDLDSNSITSNANHEIGSISVVNKVDVAKKSPSYPIVSNDLPDFFNNSMQAQNKPTRKEKALFQMFIHHFESTSRYVDHDFNLKTAAREIGTNEKYLSSAINHCSGMSFNKIVNKYRIVHAQRLINEDVLTRLNLEEIAYMSGYGNRTTFYRVFTEMVGITPSRFRDNLNRGISM